MPVLGDSRSPGLLLSLRPSPPPVSPSVPRHPFSALASRGGRTLSGPGPDKVFLLSEVLASSLVSSVNHALGKLLDIWHQIGIKEEMQLERMQAVKQHIEVKGVVVVWEGCLLTLHLCPFLCPATILPTPRFLLGGLCSASSLCIPPAVPGVLHGLWGLQLVPFPPSQTGSCSGDVQRDRCSQWGG